MTEEERVIQGLSTNITRGSLELQLVSAQVGRGVFVREPISKGDFVCEYKTTEVYTSREDARAKEAEYDINQEGSFILEVKIPNGKVVYLDATRRFEQFGRYINHSACYPNVKLARPMFLKGKWRVGFVAQRNIEAGEELRYDYGIRDPELPWTYVQPKPNQETDKVNENQEELEDEKAEEEMSQEIEGEDNENQDEQDEEPEEAEEYMQQEMDQWIEIENENQDD